MKRFLIKVISIAILAMALALVPVTAAFALVTPTTGQPGASSGVVCQNFPASPGNAANAPGSVFNPTGQAGNVYAGNPNTASLAHSNSAAAVSQYDVACRNASSH